MHELVLSESIVRAALENPDARGRTLRALTVKVGALSSVSVPSLEFCVGLVLEQRGIEGAQVRVEAVPARLRCACGHEYASEDMFCGCPRCGGFEREVLDGQDVTLESIEVEDDQDQDERVGPEP